MPSIKTMKPVQQQRVPTGQLAVSWDSTVPGKGATYIDSLSDFIIQRLRAKEGGIGHQPLVDVFIRKFFRTRWANFSACADEIGWGDDTIADVGSMMFQLWYLGYDSSDRGNHPPTWGCPDGSYWNPEVLECRPGTEGVSIG